MASKKSEFISVRRNFPSDMTLFEELEYKDANDKFKSDSINSLGGMSQMVLSHLDMKVVAGAPTKMVLREKTLT